MGAVGLLAGGAGGRLLSVSSSSLEESDRAMEDLGVGSMLRALSALALPITRLLRQIVDTRRTESIGGSK